MAALKLLYGSESNSGVFGKLYMGKFKTRVSKIGGLHSWQSCLEGVFPCCLLSKSMAAGALRLNGGPGNVRLLLFVVKPMAAGVRPG